MPLLTTVRRHAGPRLALLLCLFAGALAACGPAVAPAPSASARITTTDSSRALRAQATATAAAATITYVALGASDAFGIGTDDPDRQNWPTVLAGKLGSRVHVIDLGIPGATVASAQRDELPIALAAHPRIVTVWLAVNDFAAGVDLDTYASELTSLLAVLRAGTPAQVYVGNLPDLSLVPYFSSANPATLRAQVTAWNAAIARVCSAEGAHLVDLAAGWSALAEHPEFISSDGLHPSTAGAAQLAAVFAAAIHLSSNP
jgi:acyl-CoA thioesterase I